MVWSTILNGKLPNSHTCHLNSDGTKLNAPSFAIPCTGRASYQDSSRKAATCCQAIPNCMKWVRQTHCEFNRALGFRATEGWHFPLWLRAMLCYLDYAECIKPGKEVLFEVKIIAPIFGTFRINPYFCSRINNILTFYRYGNNKEKNPRRG